ncbi:uncharacterized protein LOC124460145 isoform X2 [Drosophila willistoni]|uniref:uncharacterized protein LOC124460145 isoform X2 n=1 Tax=Drosophila willistoni TaxID=7260 RepID=UPI001F074E53|nr:uncharacterized protein LOC124460145 isoform X2 [Drosophila willistoni]
MKLGLLKKCCCCVGLRHGCIAIAAVDFIINIVLVNIGTDHIAVRIEHAVAICHCIGCLLLLFGALIESTILLIFYLITSFINTVILIIFSIYLIMYALATTLFVVLTCSILIWD